MKYLKKFETRAEYDAVADSLITPNVSMCEDSQWISFKKKEPGPGPTPPTPGGATGLIIDAPNVVNIVGIGQTYQLTTTLEPAGVSDTVTWAARGDAVTVSETGLVTAVNYGSCVVNASVGDRQGFKKDSCMIIVSENPTTIINVTGYTLDPTETTIHVGEEITVWGYIRPTEATFNSDMMYSEDETIVGRNPMTGAFVGVSPGTTNVRARTPDGKFYATCQITVIP